MSQEGCVYETLDIQLFSATHVAFAIVLSQGNQVMTTSTTYGELLAACVAFKPDFAEKGKKETDNAFLARLMRTVADLPEETYDALSEDAVAWYDAVVTANNTKATLPIPAGYGAPAVTEAAAPVAKRTRAKPGDTPAAAPVAAAPVAAAPAPTPSAPATPVTEFVDDKGNPLKGLALVNAKRKAEKAAAAAGGTAPAAPAAKAAKPEKQKVQKKERGISAGEIIRRAMLKNLDASPEKILEIIKAAGHTEIPLVTVRTYHTDGHHVVRIAKELGLWTK